jgi:hypothetical protein
MAIFAQPTPDENLSPGWTSQGTGSAQSTTGIPGQGYATSGAIPASTALSAAYQAGSGLSQPPGTGAQSAGAAATVVLMDPGYANAGLTNGLTATTPVPTTAGVQQPFGTSADASVVVPVSVTAIQIAPFTTGTPSYVSAWNGTSSAGQVIQITVPAAGFIKMVGANATSVTYVVTP